jgi:hypothetical protein
MMVGLVIVLVITTFSTALVLTSSSHHAHAKIATERARAHALAEGAATLLLDVLDRDPVGPVRNSFAFKVHDGVFVRLYSPFEAGDGNVRVQVEYLKQVKGAWTTVTFKNRDTPFELYDRVRASVTAFRPGVERTIDIMLEQQFILFDGAIMSDAKPVSADGDGKSLAQDGHIVFDDKGRPNQFFVDGSLVSNGGVFYNDSTSPMTSENANTNMNFAGSISTDLAGTPKEIPDYTAEGSSDQLFDFDRFAAAARAGAGREFTSLADFVATMNAYNALGTPLEGITLLSLDPSKEGNNPKIQPSGSDPSQGKYAIPGGIKIRGTLVFKFAPGTDPRYKVFVTTDLDINPADLSGLNPNDPSTYPSGFDVPYSNPALRPEAVDITGSGFENFVPEDDIPALMFNNGIVDIHGGANISGLVYGPSFIEIENKEGNLQYFNGAIMGGAGVLIEGDSDKGATVVKFDRSTINNLATKNSKGMGLQLVAWRLRN